MRVLIACEFSGIVRDAFAKLGHYAMSCDLLDTERPDGLHYKGDVFDIINDGWDLMIAHPPCTYLAASGARWFEGNIERYIKRLDAIEFAERLWDAPIEKIAIENPVGYLSTMSKLYCPDQIINPWQFGHGETKKTCLWLKNLPELEPTNIVSGRSDRIHKMPGGKNQAKNRSRTYQGIADAMAQQWGKNE